MYIPNLPAKFWSTRWKDSTPALRKYLLLGFKSFSVSYTNLRSSILSKSFSDICVASTCKQYTILILSTFARLRFHIVVVPNSCCMYLLLCIWLHFDSSYNNDITKDSLRASVTYRIPFGMSVLKYTPPTPKKNTDISESLRTCSK